jgi:V8-like Glu-specific endopeptidase
MLEQLQKTLSDAFNLKTLERMVAYKLGADLYDYAAPGDKQQVIFDLLDAARREGFLEKLVAGAREANPGNEKLREFARQYGVESTRKSTQELERIIDATKPNLAPEDFRQKIFEAELRVCRIEIPVTGGTATGTGFLVAPDLVMTNYHVMAWVIEQKVKPGVVKVRFDYKATRAKTVNEGTIYKLAADWLVDSSEVGPLEEPTNNQLDYALIRLEKAAEPLAGIERGFYQLATTPEAFAPDGALFIMQHPKGRPLELAMDTKAIIGMNQAATRVRYRTNTEGGSSGSPCFTPDFELVALHHSGDPNFDPAHKPTYNQGIPISLIADRLSKSPHAAALGLV